MATPDAAHAGGPLAESYGLGSRPPSPPALAPGAPHPARPALEGQILVLGIGNLLWADEGFGVRCAEAFAERWEVPPEVRVLDGGTQGLYLLPHVQEARRLVVFDAVDYGLAPGTLKVVEDGEVPRFMGAKKMSLHQTGFQDVVAAAELTGRCPEEMLLVGVQPQQLEDFGGSLTPVVRERIPAALELAALRLRRWGVTLLPRLPGAAAAGLNHPSLERGRYEAERPFVSARGERVEPRAGKELA